MRDPLGESQGGRSEPQEGEAGAALGGVSANVAEAACFLLLAVGSHRSDPSMAAKQRVRESPS